MLVVHAASCCDVCLEQYVWEGNQEQESTVRTPYVIACGHVFCKTCLESTDPALCPLCRRRYRLDHIKKLHVEPPDVTDEDMENGFLQNIVLAWDDETGIGEVIMQVDEWLSTKNGSFGAALRRMKMLRDQFVDLMESCADMRRKHDDDKFKIDNLRAKLKHRDDTMVHENNLHMVHRENLNEHVEILKKKIQEQEEEINTLRIQLETVPRIPEYVSSSQPVSYPYPQQPPPRRESLPLNNGEAVLTSRSRDKGKGREIPPTSADSKHSGYLPYTLASNPLPAPPVPSTYTTSQPSDISSAGEARELRELEMAFAASRLVHQDPSTYDPSTSAAGPSGLHHYSNAATPPFSVTNGYVADTHHQPSAQYPQPSSFEYPQMLQANGVLNYAGQPIRNNSSTSSQHVNGSHEFVNDLSHALTIAMQEAQQQRNSPPRRVRVVNGAPEEERIVPDMPYVRQGDIYRDPLAPIVEESSDTGSSSRKRGSEDRRRRKKKRDSQPEVSDQEAREHWSRKASEREDILGVTGLGLIDEDNSPVTSNIRAAAIRDGYEEAYKEAFDYASSVHPGRTSDGTSSSGTPGASSAPRPTNNGTSLSGTGKIQQINPRRQVPPAAMLPQMIQARQKAQPLPSSYNRQLGRHDDAASILSGLSSKTWGSYLSTRSAGSDVFNHLNMFSRTGNGADNPNSWEVSASDPHAFLPPRTGNDSSTATLSQSSPAHTSRRSATATGGPTATSIESRRPSTSSTVRPPSLGHAATMPDMSSLQLFHSEGRRRDRDSDRERRRSSRRSSTRPSNNHYTTHPQSNMVEASSQQPLVDGNALGLNLHTSPEPQQPLQIVAPTPITPHDMFLRSFSNDTTDSGRQHY